MSLVYEMFGKKMKDLTPDEKAKYCNVASKKYYAKHKGKHQKTHYEATMLDHHIIYYLPEEHYCGVTSNPARRMATHRYHGNNIEGWRVLACYDTLLEARHHENLFHSVLGMEGMSLR